MASEIRVPTELDIIKENRDSLIARNIYPTYVLVPCDHRLIHAGRIVGLTCAIGEPAWAVVKIDTP